MHSVIGDIIVISGLAIKVQTAYKVAPDNYRHISDEVGALRILVNKVAQYFKSTTISSDCCYDGQKVLKGCLRVLEDLNSLFEKYKSRVSTNTRIALEGVKCGEENILSLQERLIFHIGLLRGFVQRLVVQIRYSTHQPMDIDIFIVVANILKSKHSWLLFLVSITQDQEFQSPLLPPL